MITKAALISTISQNVKIRPAIEGILLYIDLFLATSVARRFDHLYINRTVFNKLDKYPASAIISATKRDAWAI